MKSIFDMSGTEKAAALLMILGPEIASDIMKYLDEASIEKLSAGMMRMQSLPAEEKEDLIGEFMIGLKRTSKNLYGGRNRARKLIEDAFGEERAGELIARMENRDADSAFKFIDEMDDDVFCSMLKSEQPQVIALVLKYVQPKKAGLLMKSLEPKSSREVALRLAKMKNPSSEAAVAVARALKKRYDDMRKSEAPGMQGGGIESLVSIITHMSSEQEKRILQGMDISMPDLSREISERIFSFESVLNLTNIEIRILIDEINDDILIAKALKGAGDEIKFKFMRNMSQNRATAVLGEMDLMGPLKLSEIDQCRTRILEIMRVLNDNGVISIRRNGEIYVE